MYQFHPLNNENQFECLIKDLLDIKFIEYANFDLYGKKGQTQFGNDVIGYNNKGKMILAQAKKKDISRKNLQNELLKEFENEISNILFHFQKQEIDKIIFATTYKRDTVLQDKAQELTQKYNIEILYWGWDTIEEIISISKNIQNKYFTLKNIELLTILPEIPYCIGRDNDLNIIEKLFEKEDIINIQSIGGLGKSTLVNSFIHRDKEKFDFIGHVTIEDDLEEALFRTLHHFFNFSQNDNIENIIYKLQLLKGDKLLIIDNLLYQKDIKYIKMLSNNFKVLITSRIIFNDIKNIELKPLNSNFLKELFFQYNTEAIQDEKLNILFHYLDYHTLFIELTAKTINNNDFSIDYIIDEFNNGNLPKISIEVDLDTYEEKIYNSFLIKLFEKSIEDIDEEFFFLLVLLSLFPSINLHIKQISRVFDLDIHKELLLLTRKGWLLGIDKNIYKIHQIIKEFLLYNFPLKCKNIVPIITYYLNSIQWDEVEHPHKQQEYMIFVRALIDGVYDVDGGLAILSNNLAMLYRYFGYYDLALKYMLIVKDYDEKNNNEGNLAQTYNNLAQVYFSLQENEIAEEYNFLSLQLREKDHQFNIHENYLSICNRALSQSDYVKAKKYLDMLLSIEQPDKKSIIPIYNAAILYFLNTKNIKLAFEYANKVLQIIENNEVDEKHLYIAYTYSNIADIYMAETKFDLAIEHKLKAKQHLLKNFGETHPDLVWINESLETLFLIQELRYSVGL